MEMLEDKGRRVGDRRKEVRGRGATIQSPKIEFTPLARSDSQILAFSPKHRTRPTFMSHICTFKYPDRSLSLDYAFYSHFNSLHEGYGA